MTVRWEILLDYSGKPSLLTGVLDSRGFSQLSLVRERSDGAKRVRDTGPKRGQQPSNVVNLWKGKETASRSELLERNSLGLLAQ
jgi:hypothetical protein